MELIQSLVNDFNDAYCSSYCIKPFITRSTGITTFSVKIEVRLPDFKSSNITTELI